MQNCDRQLPFQAYAQVSTQNNTIQPFAFLHIGILDKSFREAK